MLNSIGKADALSEQEPCQTDKCLQDNALEPVSLSRFAIRANLRTHNWESPPRAASAMVHCSIRIHGSGVARGLQPRSPMPSQLSSKAASPDSSTDASIGMSISSAIAP